MADYKVTDAELTSIANAIRTKGGTSSQLEFPTGFVSAVQAIPTGGSPTLKDETFTQNGQYTAGEGYDGFGTVTVNVSGGVPAGYKAFPYGNPVGSFVISFQFVSSATAT